MTDWFDQLYADRQEWVDSSRKNKFEQGIRQSTVDKYADPEEVRVFLDVQNAHETLIAHELMHLWMWFVEGNVGEKTLKDRSDRARRNQLDFIQSFVLDVRVNDLIEKRGFDMSLICEDQVRGLKALRSLMMTGFVPPTRREQLTYALQIAGAVLEQDRLSRAMRVQLAGMLEFFEAAAPEIYSTATQLVRIVNRRPLDTRDALSDALDECTLLGFRFTGDNLALERDFNDAASPECMHDKFPNELTKYDVPLKLEIWKTMSRLGIEGYGQVHVNTSPSGMAVLTFEPEGGGLIGPIHLNYRMTSPDWIIEQEGQRLLHEQKQLAARRAPIGPNAPYRHIPMLERPRIKGMIPDDYGRLPGDNGYNTSYPLGQDPFSLMDAANAHLNSGGAAQGQIGGPWQGNAQGANQYGRPTGHPDYMVPFPPVQPNIPRPYNTASWRHADPAPGGPPVFPWLDTNRGYMAGLTRSIAEARLAQQAAMNSLNLYVHAENNPVNRTDPSGLDTRKPTRPNDPGFETPFTPCYKMSPGACFWCAFRISRHPIGGGQYLPPLPPSSPEMACAIANLECNSHVNCKLFAPGNPGPALPGAPRHNWVPVDLCQCIDECLIACATTDAPASACRDACAAMCASYLRRPLCDELWNVCFQYLKKKLPREREICLTFYDSVCSGE